MSKKWVFWSVSWKLWVRCYCIKWCYWCAIWRKPVWHNVEVGLQALTAVSLKRAILEVWWKFSCLIIMFGQAELNFVLAFEDLIVLKEKELWPRPESEVDMLLWTCRQRHISHMWVIKVIFSQKCGSFSVLCMLHFILNMCGWEMAYVLNWCALEQ